jgi:GT2 family glycosyltransferase
MVKARFPLITLVENETNTGFARANNQALRRCRGEFLLLLNSDAELRPGALARLVGFMVAHSRAGGAGPLLLNTDGTLQHSAAPLPTPERELWRLSFLDRLAHWATYDQKRWPRHQPRRVEVLKGACILLRRQALDQVGCLDDSYFFYSEEIDLCHRLALAGWELWWVPQAEVLHHGGASSRQASEEMYLQLFRSKVRYYRKFGGESQAIRFKHFVRIAYWPRLAIASFLAAFSPGRGRQAHIYRRLLAELASM